VDIRKTPPGNRMGFLVMLGLIGVLGATTNAKAACLSKVIGKQGGSAAGIPVVVPRSEVREYVAAGYVEQPCPTEPGYVAKVANHWCNPPEKVKLPDAIWQKLYGVSRVKMCASAKAVLAEVSD
jgi:hypothetical protein